MRSLFALAFTVSAVACGGSAPAAQTPASSAPPAAAPAKPFSMRTYWLVMLRRGPAWTAEKTPETKKLFEGHMANIQAMAKAGKLVLAGPFEADAADKQAYAGLFIFDVQSKAELDQLLAGDPAIVAGRFAPEIMSWYGPAGLTYDGKEESLK